VPAGFGNDVERRSVAGLLEVGEESQIGVDEVADLRARRKSAESWHVHNHVGAVPTHMDILPGVLRAAEPKAASARRSRTAQGK
jgi:hypothetical protein